MCDKVDAKMSSSTIYELFHGKHQHVVASCFIGGKQSQGQELGSEKEILLNKKAPFTIYLVMNSLILCKQ